MTNTYVTQYPCPLKFQRPLKKNKPFQTLDVEKWANHIIKSIIVLNRDTNHTFIKSNKTTSKTYHGISTVIKIHTYIHTHIHIHIDTYTHTYIQQCN